MSLKAATGKEKNRRAQGKKSGPRDVALELLGRGWIRGADWERSFEGLPENDRALVRNLVSGTFRQRGKIDFYLGSFLRGEPQALPDRLLNILRLAVYQLKFCDRLPDYAVVHEAVEQAKRLPGGGKLSGLVNGVLRTLLREWDSIALPAADRDPAAWLAVNYSHPLWLVRRYLGFHGFAFTEALLAANNTQAPLVVRSEEAAAGVPLEDSKLLRRFAGSGIKAGRGAYAPEALILSGNSPPPRALPGFEEGLLYLQDEAAMLPARLARPVPGSLILDLCAAPGGKITHLARLAGESAVLVAADLNPDRLAGLRENFSRLGLGGIKLYAGDARFPALRRADLVLCDVPCSGTGVMRRKPDLRWRIREEDLPALAGLQREILEAAAALTAPEGTLLYSTCSLEPEENWEVVRTFLDGHPDFRLEPADDFIDPRLVSPQGCLASYPHIHGIDGAFAARLVRKKSKRR